MFMQAPPSEIHPSVLPLISMWNSPVPTALQALEVLDVCIYNASASTFVVTALQEIYENCLKLEGKTHEELVTQATTWRAKQC